MSVDTGSLRAVATALRLRRAELGDIIIPNMLDGAATELEYLRSWARLVLEHFGNTHVPGATSMRALLGPRPAIACTDPTCDRACNCHTPDWGGHSVSTCAHLRAALEPM